MRASLNFNTLKFMEELEEAGMDQEQAKAITNATAKAFTQMMETQEIATKSDLARLELSLRSEIKESVITTIKWMITISFSQAALILGIMSYIMKK
jgi:uncharacterized protein YegJ (DUF2314 family)